MSTNAKTGFAALDAPEIFFEDFSVGRSWERDGPELTEASITGFAAQYDPQYFHMDATAAERSMFGGLIASGWQTVGITMRLICDAYLLRAASLGSPGIDQLRWLLPVRPGDRLRMKMTVVEARPSKSKPDRGSVLHLWEATNQNGELVLTMQGWGMFLKRNPPAPDPVPGTAA